VKSGTVSLVTSAAAPDHPGDLLHDAVSRAGSRRPGPIPNRAIALAGRIRREVVESGWPVGRVLGSEDELARRYNVGRPVLRQAARLLEHQSVAMMRRGPGGGLVVVEPDGDSVTEAIALYLQYRDVAPRSVFDARTALELACVQTATEQLSEAGIAQLRALLDREAAAPADEAIAHAQDFHAAIAELTGNAAMLVFVRSLGRLTHERTRTPDDLRPQADDVRLAHRRIAEAIIAGDAGLARHRMLRHLQGIAEHLT
jgi:DNA-binding FadR family transcriptional regulator